MNRAATGGRGLHALPTENQESLNPRNRTHTKRMARLSFLALISALLLASAGQAATRTATTNGNWNNNATWGNNPFPVAGDTANIPNGITVTIATARTEACTTLTLNSNSGNNAALNFTDSTSALNVSGTATIGTANSGGGGTVSLSVDTGTFTCNALTFVDNGRDIGQIRISTGSTTVTNNITMVGAVTRSRIDFTGAGTISVGGTLTGGGIVTASGCTVNYTGAAQTVLATTYENLTLSGSGAKTLGGNTTVNATLSRQGTATFALGGNTLTYGANANLEYKGSAAQTTSTNEFPASMPASIVINNASGVSLDGAKTLSKDLTLTAGALDVTASNFAISIAGNWTNNGGSLTARSGTVTFNASTGTQTISGSTTFFNLTLNNSGATTDFGTSSTTIANNLTTTAGTMTASTSTITFTGASGTISGANAKNFFNLVINSGASISNSTGGNTTIKGDYTNNGTFTQSSGLSTTFDATSATHNFSGSGTTTFGVVMINASTTVNAGAHSFTSTGTPFTVNGTFNGGTGTVTFSSSTTLAGSGTISFNNLTISGTLTNNVNNKSFNVAGNWTNNSIYTAGTETITFNGSTAQTIGGSQPTTFSGLKVSNSAGVTLGVNAIVNGVLDLASGDIKTATFTLFQGGTSSATGIFDVVGSVNRGDVAAGSTKSFGNVNVKITQDNLATGSDITITLAKSTPSDFANAITRKYTITKNGGTFTTATVRLRYKLAELNGNTNEAILQLWREDGTTWGAQGASSRGTAVDSDRWVEKTLITGFSPWTIAGTTAPTDVTMADYSAHREGKGKALIRWETGFEVDNLGFNIYRQEGTQRTRVNRSLIAGSALTTRPGTRMTAGSSYAWRDSLPKGSNAFYWLEEINMRGQSIWHGPIFVNNAAPPKSRYETVTEQALTLADMSADAVQQAPTLPRERAAALVMAASAPVTSWTIASHPAVKLSVAHEGFYRVSKAELVAAGLDSAQNPVNLQLFVDGLEQPMKVVLDQNGQLSGIEFYGVGLDTLSTDTHVYWLAAGDEPGKRILNVPSTHGFTGPNSFQYAVERRDRSIYVSGITNGDAENFFGALVYGGPVDQIVNLTHVDQSTQAQATLEIGLQGLSLLPHHVVISLNGTSLGALDFSNQANAATTFSVPSSLLQEGSNTITLSPDTTSVDVSLVDHINVTYWHSYTADSNALKLTASGSQRVSIDGFSSGNVRVVDVTDPEAVVEISGIVAQQNGIYNVTFSTPGTGSRTLLAFADDQVRAVTGAAANGLSNLRSKANAADLVIIANKSVLDSFRPLQALRQKQGYRVSMVDVEDAYDEFSFGNKTPQAIKDLLAYTTTHWRKVPKYVLLAGGASYDPRNYNGYGSFDLVPTKLVNTSFNETASDDWFADFNNDGMPEMAVGRLPANTAAEASTMVSKIIGYDSSTGSNSITLVADQNDEFDFEATSAKLEPLIPSGITIGEIDRGQLGTTAAKQQLLGAISQGQKIINYVGHGSGSVWRDNLFTTDDALSLTNAGSLPLFVAMTCLNGWFQTPGANSLAVALLKAENGGAVAVWASSGFTEPDAQSVMNQQLYTLLFQSGKQPPTLGDAMLKAKASVSDIDVRRTWILFGDPTTKLK